MSTPPSNLFSSVPWVPRPNASAISGPAHTHGRTFVFSRTSNCTKGCVLLADGCTLAHPDTLLVAASPGASWSCAQSTCMPASGAPRVQEVPSSTRGSEVWCRCRWALPAGALACGDLRFLEGKDVGPDLDAPGVAVACVSWGSRRTITPSPDGQWVLAVPVDMPAASQEGGGGGCSGNARGAPGLHPLAGPRHPFEKANRLGATHAALAAAG